MRQPTVTNTLLTYVTYTCHSPWKSIGKFDMVKAIYGDKTDLLQRYVELTLLFLTLTSNIYTQRINGCHY